MDAGGDCCMGWSVERIGRRKAGRAAKCRLRQRQLYCSVPCPYSNTESVAGRMEFGDIGNSY